MLNNKIFNCWKQVTFWRNKKNNNNDDNNSNINDDTSVVSDIPKVIEKTDTDTDTNILDTYLNKSFVNTTKINISEHDSRVNELTNEIKTLKEKLFAIENNSWGEYIDKYIDKWYDVNKKEVDIGVVNVGGLFNIDLLPDNVEKYLYKKVIKIIFSMVSDLKS